MIKDILKKLIKESSIYALGPTMQAAVGFFLVPVYTKFLTPVEYGSLEFILAIAAFIAPIIDGGTTSAFWKYGTGDSRYNKHQVLSNCMIGQFVFAFLLVISTLLITSFKPSNESIKLFFIYSFVIVSRAWLQIIFLEFQSSHRVYHYVSISSINALLVGICNLITVAHLKMGIRGIIIGNLFGTLITCIAFIPFYKNSFQFFISYKLLKDIYRYGLPLVAGNIFFLVLTTSDRFFLSHFTTSHDLGLYAYGYDFSTLLTMFIITPFFLGFNPVRWEIYSKNNSREIFSNLYTVIFSVLVLLYFLFVFCGIFLGTIMAGRHEFVKGLIVLPLLCFSSLLYGLYYFRSMGLLFEKKTYLISIVVTLSAGVSLIFNFVMVPKFQMLGAGVSSVLAFLCMFFLCSYFSQKFYYIKVNTHFEIFGLGLAGLLCLITYILRDIVSPMQIAFFSLIMGLLFTLLVILNHRRKLGNWVTDILSKGKTITDADLKNS